MRTRDVALALCLLTGFKPVRASRFNLASGYNDDPQKRTTPFQEPEAGAFKVPTLRHLMLTAPYGHDGKRETLAEQTDLVVFLESVSTLSNPWRPEDHGRCH